MGNYSKSRPIAQSIGANGVYILCFCVAGFILAYFYTTNIKGDYLNYHENNNVPSRSGEKIATWLGDRLATLQANQNEIDIYSRDISSAKVVMLNRAVAEAQNKIDEISIALNVIENIKQSNMMPDVAPRLLGNSVIFDLKKQMVDLKQQKSALDKRYGVNHPKMINFMAQFNALSQQIDNEIDVFFVALKEQKNLQNRQLNQYEDKLAEFKNTTTAPNIQSDFDETQKLLTDLVTTYQTAINDLRNIKRDDVAQTKMNQPEAQSNHIHIILLGGLTGLLIGIFIDLLRDKNGYVVTNADDLNRLFDIPIYGKIPKANIGKDQNLYDFIISNSNGVVSEYMRSLLSTIKLRNPRAKSGGRVITMTSTHSGEGKTTNAIWLGIAAAQSGDKVVIVDADMRRPSLNKYFNIGNAKGIADYLSDRLPLDDVIYKRHRSGVDLITAKAIPTYALTLLSNERTESMVRRLRDMYDLVIIDAPGSSVFSDARVLASLSDKVMYIVEWKKTLSRNLIATITHFSEMKYNDLFFVINKVNIKREKNFSKRDKAYLQD